VVLLESLPNDQQTAENLALQVAEKIRFAIDRPFVIQDSSGRDLPDIIHRCTSSIGVVVFLGKTFNQTQVLSMADAAMYQAKNAGKNHVHLYHSTGT